MDEIEAKNRRLIILQHQLKKARKALRLMLPLAKEYVASAGPGIRGVTHSYQKFIDLAEISLAEIKEIESNG